MEKTGETVAMSQRETSEDLRRQFGGCRFTMGQPII